MSALAAAAGPAAIHTFLQPPPYDELTEVEPGIWWLRLRLPFALDHVNVWLLEDGDGWTLIDTGVSDTATRAVWERVLTRLPIARILITHFHPDHFGLAGWLRDRTGAPVLMSRTEWLTGRLLSLDQTDEALDVADAHYRRRRDAGGGERRPARPWPRLQPARTHDPAHVPVAGGRSRAHAGRQPLARHHRPGPRTRAGDALLPRAPPADRRRPDPAAHLARDRRLVHRPRPRPAGRVPDLAPPVPRPARGHARPPLPRRTLHRPARTPDQPRRAP